MAGARQQRLQPRQQLAHLERFSQVIVRAELEADDLVDRLAARREHDQRCRDTAPAQVAAEIEPALARQHDVEDDRVEALARGARQAGLAVVAGLDRVPLVAQPVGQGHHQPWLVFDKQDAFAHRLQVAGFRAQGALMIVFCDLRLATCDLPRGSAHASCSCINGLALPARSRLAAVAGGAGQVDREGAAVARRALHHDSPAVRLDDLADDAQAQAAAVDLRHNCVVAAVERLDDVREIVGRAADAGIPHGSGVSPTSIPPSMRTVFSDCARRCRRLAIESGHAAVLTLRVSGLKRSRVIRPFSYSCTM